MNTQSMPEPSLIYNQTSVCLLLNIDEPNEVSDTKYEKEGWLNQRKGYFRKWKKRYARVEQQQYLCTYQSDNDDLINCVDTIDLTESTIQYTLDEPTQFTINTNNSNNNDTEHSFQCATVSETNEWLTVIYIYVLKQKQITATNATYTNTDVDLLTSKPISSRGHRVAIYNENETKISAASKLTTKDIMVTDMEINDIYMKAVVLYQHKHYEECERVIKTVLTCNPNHKQAERLFKYLADKKHKLHNELNAFDNPQNKNKRSKKIKRVKFGTVGNYNKYDPYKSKKNSPLKKRKSIKRIFKRKSTVSNVIHSFNVSNGKRIEKNIIKDEEKQKEILNRTRCQLEFERFLEARVYISKYYNYKELIDKFIDVKYNDIRFMKDFNKNILEKEIGLRPLHCSLFMRKIKTFMNENKSFKEWLKQIVIKQKFNDISYSISIDAIIDLFENNGIMTFEQLHKYIKTKLHLEIIFGALSANDCNILWMEIENLNKLEITKICVDEGVFNPTDVEQETENNDEGLIVDTGYH